MSTERWIYVREDGQLIFHAENDGWTFARRGPEAREREISLEELKNYATSATDGPSYENGLRMLAEWHDERLKKKRDEQSAK